SDCGILLRDGQIIRPFLWAFCLRDSQSGPVKANRPTEVHMTANDDASGGLMATARTTSGAPIMNRIPNGNDLVKYGGMEFSLNVAANMGLVQRNPDGTYSDKEASAALKDPASQAQAQTKADNAQGKTESAASGVSFGEAGDTVMKELMSAQNPGDLFKSIDSVIHTGNLDKGTIERMASMAGVEPEEMMAQVTTVWQGAYDAATDFMADVGIEDEGAFTAFLNDNPKLQANLMESARNFFVHHKTEGLQTMADAYLPQMDRYEGDRVRAMLTDAGYDHTTDGKGRVRVNIDGASVGWDVAVQQRIITFSQG
uniref:hypothetical protein n=1 Tax=Marivita sp. TaxID=2003365 RepID=UPI003F6FC8B3